MTSQCIRRLQLRNDRFRGEPLAESNSGIVYTSKRMVNEAATDHNANAKSVVRTDINPEMRCGGRAGISTGKVGQPSRSQGPQTPVKHSNKRSTAVRVCAEHSVAVVVPNFKCGIYLQSCIESLKRQTVKCDIVVVDDRSTDNSLEQLRPYAGDIRLIQHSKNLGANAARVTGIQHSRST